MTKQILAQTINQIQGTRNAATLAEFLDPDASAYNRQIVDAARALVMRGDGLAVYVSGGANATVWQKPGGEPFALLHDDRDGAS